MLHNEGAVTFFHSPCFFILQSMKQDKITYKLKKYFSFTATFLRGCVTRGVSDEKPLAKPKS